MARKKQNRKRILSDDDKEKLLKKHIGLLVVIAEKYAYLCRLLEIQDLVQEGWFALVDAAEYFNKNMGKEFSSYAVPAIEERILDHINVHERELHTPAYVAKDRHKCREARKKLIDENEQIPSLEEVQEETGLPMRRVKLVAEIARRPPVFFHVDQSSQDGGLPSGRFIVDKQRKFKTPEDQMLMKEALSALQEHLTPREIKIVKLRLGRDNNNPLLWKEIGRIMGLSKERPAQIYKEVIKRLQQALKD